MRLVHHGLPFALGLAALLGLSAAATAATSTRTSLSDLVARADRIVESEVVEVRCERDPARGDDVPVTLVTVRVARTLKGAGSTHLVLELLGGRVGDQGVEVLGMPRFAVGDRDVLFLAPASRSVSPLVGVTRGRFRVVYAQEAPRERVAAFDGRPLVTRELEEQEPGVAEASAAPAVSLDAFEKRVLQLVAGESAPSAARSRGRRLEPEGVLADPLPRLAVDVNLGPSPALLDGCPDWACALTSNAVYRRVTAPAAAGDAGAPVAAERVSLEWGNGVFGRAMDADTLALSVRLTRGDASTTTVIFNRQLWWNAYGDGGAASVEADGPHDLPEVAARELGLAVAAASEAAAAASRPPVAPARAGSRAAAPSRGEPTALPLEVSAACGPGDVFVDPRLLVFDSPDHALMTAYQVGFFQPGAGSPAQVVDVPLTAFLVRRVVDLPSWAVVAMQSSLVADIRGAGLATPIGVVYTYRVRGVWGGGTTAWSDGSQPFVRCATAAAAR
jgi:hypothetical protein